MSIEDDDRLTPMQVVLLVLTVLMAIALAGLVIGLPIIP